MSIVRSADGIEFDVTAGVLIIGAGAAGLVAALAAKAEGSDVLVVERDAVPSGSTALSAGLIPAAGTKFQRAQGIDDSVEQFTRDILAKSDGKSNAATLDVAVKNVGPALEWLNERFGLAFDVIADFKYPGHSRFRMHGLKRRTGSELIDELRSAAEREDIPIITSSRATTLFVDAEKRIRGIEIARGGGTERIGCHALVLACNGYGGNKALVMKHIPALADAWWFGHPGNEGDAVMWGEALGARLADMSGHQGHGSVATPHGILITWATITEGGFQVNTSGERFSDESHGYSEQGAVVLAEADGIAWTIFDARIAAIARQFEDFRNAEAQGAIMTANDVSSLAVKIGVSSEALAKTFATVSALRGAGAVDTFGRNWANMKELTPPFHAVKVTGALFHTQGGLSVASDTRVVTQDGSVLPNLYAAGGAAVGVSGPDASGYLSGNGLLTAVGLGFVAGKAAASMKPLA